MMRTFLKGLVLGLAVSSIQFSLIEGASWFSWGKKLSIDVASKEATWNVWLEKQRYGLLFEDLDLTHDSLVEEELLATRSWIKKHALKKKSLDPFISLMHARNYFGSRSKGLDPDVYTEAFVSVVLCIELIKIAESVLNVSRVQISHLPADGWTGYIIRKFREDPNYRIEEKLQIPLVMENAKFKDVKDKILTILTADDVVSKIASPYWLVDLNYKSTSWGLVWPNVVERSGDGLQEATMKKALGEIVQASLSEEIEFLKKVNSWDDFFDQRSTAVPQPSQSSSDVLPNQALSGDTAHQPLLPSPLIRVDTEDLSNATGQLSLNDQSGKPAGQDFGIKADQSSVHSAQPNLSDVLALQDELQEVQVADLVVTRREIVLELHNDGQDQRQIQNSSPSLSFREQQILAEQRRELDVEQQAAVTATKTDDEA